jgi:hypothetical protein
VQDLLKDHFRHHFPRSLCQSTSSARSTRLGLAHVDDAFSFSGTNGGFPWVCRPPLQGLVPWCGQAPDGPQQPGTVFVACWAVSDDSTYLDKLPDKVSRSQALLEAACCTRVRAHSLTFTGLSYANQSSHTLSLSVLSWWCTEAVKPGCDLWNVDPVESIYDGDGASLHPAGLLSLQSNTSYFVVTSSCTFIDLP